MHFQLLTLASIFVTGILATPLTTRQTDVTSNLQTEYVELYRENAIVSDGQLIYYGPDGEAPAESNSLKERATCTSTGTVTCSTKNTARNDACDNLIQEFNLDMSVSVPGSPRQICYLGNTETNEYCCVSWSKPISNLEKGDLYTVAYTMFSQCTESGVSGVTVNVNIDNVCLDVCLSDRGTGCN